MSFETYNLNLIDDIIKTVWYTSDLKNLYHNPIILQEEDVGHTNNFLQHLQEKLLDLCLQILPKDFVVIEKKQKVVFYNDSGSDLDDSDYESDHEPSPSRIFLETLPEEKKIVIFKVKSCIKKFEKLSIMKESFKTKEMKKEEEEEEKKCLVIENEWTSPTHFCDVSFEKEIINESFSNLPEINIKTPKIIPDFDSHFKRKTRKRPTSSTNVLSTIFNFELSKQKDVKPVKPKTSVTPKTDDFIFVKKKSNTPKHTPKHNNKHTKLCIYKDKGCSRHKKGCCNFAHSFEEWNPIVCNFGNKCKKFPKCSFFHPDKETKLEFHNRTK